MGMNDAECITVPDEIWLPEDSVRALKVQLACSTGETFSKALATFLRDSFSNSLANFAELVSMSVILNISCLTCSCGLET